jgi:replicative DNA helicase
LNSLSDPGLERRILSSIVVHGPNGMLEVDGLVESSDFTVPLNRQIWQCVSSIYESQNQNAVFDKESIKTIATSLGLDREFRDTKTLEYLELLDRTPLPMENLEAFARKLKALTVSRQLIQIYNGNIDYLSNLDRKQTLDEILVHCESKTLDYITSLSAGSADQGDIGADIISYVEEMIESEEVDQVGVPTGFNIWDNAIGGGPRPASVHVIVSRSKVGKSFLGLSMAKNVSSTGIPVGLFDSELTRSYQRNRLICMDSGCPLRIFEERKFKTHPQFVEPVREAARRIDNMPLYYETIAGYSVGQILSSMRRWIIRKVGLNEEGKANPCMIVYDYLKLTSGEGLSGHTPEYILLGLIMTELHNFSIKYGVPIVVFCQTNRDGIDVEDTSIVSGSDRILWLCSSLSLFKNKSETDFEAGSPIEDGNKRLVVLETRHGAGLEHSWDYINIHASLRPGVGQMEATGAVREGFLLSTVRKHRLPKPEPKLEAKDDPGPTD